MADRLAGDDLAPPEHERDRTGIRRMRPPDETSLEHGADGGHGRRRPGNGVDAGRV
jgi:hypothetical protein